MTDREFPVYGTTSNSVVQTGATPGTSRRIAREDHQHNGNSLASGLPPGNSAPGDVAATGSSVSFARRDHLHGRESFGLDADISDQDFSDVADSGTSPAVARADHLHGMPASPGGSPAVDPGDIADPTMATPEDVANKLNDLMAAMRTAGTLV